MNRIKKKNNHNGFTLVELIIYIGIVSMILVSVSYLIFDIISSQTKAYAHLEVDQNLRFIKEVISRDIKKSTDFNVPSDDILELNGGAIIYTFDGTDKKITRQEGVKTVDANTNEVEVEGKFTNLSYNQRNKNVRIHIDLNYKNPENITDYEANQSIDFTVEVRGRR